MAIVKKNIRIYYSKGPVIIFGLLLPFFLFLAFSIGRSMPAETLLPGLLGMTVFFSASSVGPAIVPWESRSRTLERLISTPISIWAIFLGDALSSFLFGVLISVVPLIISVLIGVNIQYPFILGFSLILADLCFAAFSVLLSAYPPSDVPASAMMLSSLVKFPLIFISGVFIPVQEMPEWARIIALFSPLTYFTDLARYSIGGASYLSPLIDFLILAAFTAFFLTLSIKLHERTLPKRLA